MNKQPTILIIGYGFLGKEIGNQAIGKGYSIVTIGRSDVVIGNGNIKYYRCDISDESEVSDLCEQVGCEFDAIIHCASSKRGGVEVYENVFYKGWQNIIKYFRSKYFLFTSSSSVYHQIGGEVVTEKSPTNPISETSKVLLRTEEFILNNTSEEKVAVARLSGIYGKGRGVYFKKFFEGTARVEIHNGTSRFINMVHGFDCASAIIFMIENKLSGIFNVVDDMPVSQLDFYNYLAFKYNKSVPEKVEPDFNRKRGWTNKRVLNTKLKQNGWLPKYKSFKYVLENEDISSYC